MNLDFELIFQNLLTASRFALMELKTLLYYLFLNYSLAPNAKSEIPLKIKKTAFSIQPENGLFLDLIPRTQRKQ